VNPGAIEVSDNGIDDDCNGFVDDVPDAYEPNDSLVTAANIGTTSEDDVTPIQINANMHVTSDEDWYTAQVSEEDSSLDPNDLEIVVSLSNIPVGSDYDLFVSCTGPGDCVVTVDNTLKSGNTDESITIVADDEQTGGIAHGSDDSTGLRIEVRNVSNTASANEYTLNITVT
jgi:hypothetical protein